MNTTEYNGYPNHITWGAFVYYDPQDLEELEYSKQSINESIEEVQCPFLKHTLYLITGEIDWEYLSNNF